MKNFFRIIALMLTLAIVMTVGLVGCKKETSTSYPTTPIDVTANYDPLMGTNSEWLNGNPDRGYRTEMTVYLFDTFENNPEYKDDPRAIDVNGTEQEIRKAVDFILRTYLLTENTLTIAYISFNDCSKEEYIPQKYLDALDIYFEACRARKLRVIWRHCYGLTTNKYVVNKDDLEYLKAVCADQDTMIRHIKQIGEYMKKHLDVIHKVSSGVIGNGEYTTTMQYPPVDTEVITDAIVRYMCVPNDLLFSVRLPRYKKYLLDKWQEEHGEEYPYADYIGFNNDCMYGETETLNANSACFQYNHNAHTCKSGDNCYKRSDEYFDEWQYVIENCAYTSQCGEMFTNNGMVNVARIFADGIEMIVEVAHHRHTTMSNWHTMGETGEGANTPDTNTMVRWVERETVTAEQLDELGIIYDPNWFLDEDGDEISRNPYDFIRDHLGYKLVAEKSTVKGDLGRLGKLSVDLTFKNYGFAAAFFLESGFAILDSKYNVVSSVKAGEPDKWISLPADYYTTEKSSSVQDDVISYTINAELTLPEAEGTYYIAFYLKNDLNAFAMLSNDIEFEGDGYNILHTIKI